MNNEQSHILVIDDEESIRRLLQKELAGGGREIVLADCAAKAMHMVRDRSFDVIIMDLRLPDIAGLDLLIKVRDVSPCSEVIMITGHGDIDTAVEAMKFGAYDFIAKPFNLDRLDLLVEKAHQRSKLLVENRLLRHNMGNKRSPVQFVGKSKAIKDIQYLIDKVAPATIPVLITGESGAGKDVVANAIHARSVRAENPMIIKNCASLQKDLARSELFGHARGSFTGAAESQEGLMSFAHQSTFFLDEIGELSLGVQASLLRLLETQTYRRVGEKEERKVDIRFLFATNRNLAREVQKGRFNEAFFHRINVFNISIPSLCEHKEDLPLLVDYFLTKLSPDGTIYQVAQGAMECLLHYDWPGNVRELRNVLERCIILAENGVITKNCLPHELLMGEGQTESAMSLESMEKQHILKIFDFYNGNRQKTADALGISRKTLYRKMNLYQKEV